MLKQRASILSSQTLSTLSARSGHKQCYSITSFARGRAVDSKRAGFLPADYAALYCARLQGVTHHGHASDKLSRLLVRLHQSENLLQPRDHITGLQKVLLLSDVAPEDSGDGIMSAIDFDMTMERQPDQKGDRVKIGMSGKFLGYKTY